MQVKQRAYHNYHGQAVADKVGRHAEKGVLKRHDVVGNARHKPRRGVLDEKVVRKRDELVLQFIAQLPYDVLRNVIHKVVLTITGQPLYKEHYGYKQRYHV